jgi:hypothetical protein
MTTRIQDLILQVGTDTSGKWMRVDQAEKFAELIVRECADHALTFNNTIQSLNNKEIRSHSNRVSDYIKDRMGVKE